MAQKDDVKAATAKVANATTALKEAVAANKTATEKEGKGSAEGVAAETKVGGVDSPHSAPLTTGGVAPTSAAGVWGMG
jgi:hypothetical protein